MRGERQLTGQGKGRRLRRWAVSVLRKGRELAFRVLAERAAPTDGKDVRHGLDEARAG